MVLNRTGSSNSERIKTMSKQNTAVVCIILPLITLLALAGQRSATTPQIFPIAPGWAANSVNAVIFRHNAIVTHNTMQYAAFYDDQSNIVLAKRRIGTANWEIRKTQHRGNIRDAHNSISIMVDGDGFLHMSWDQHNNELHYCRSPKSGSLEMRDKESMTGRKERHVTYPEFHRFPDGNLIFIYRDGSSGAGNIMMNHYDTKSKVWSQLQDGFIDGEGQRNAYWQATIDTKGVIHISWVWRENWDVATNHDLCYAQSLDGGKTWQKSNGEKYALPITMASAEYVCRIPQKSELINQTSMCADEQGHPYIATYWRPKDTEVPQYHLVYHDGKSWHTLQVSKRKVPFRLSGGGTRRIPISRPQILIQNNGTNNKAYMIFRDIERDNRISIAICDDLQRQEWRFEDLSMNSVNMWEPTYDTELWIKTGILSIFVQNVGQGDNETTENIPPQPVSIMDWRP